MMFSDALQLELKLDIKGKDFNISGGNIKSFEVNLYNHGFTAQVDFWQSLEGGDDTVFSSFVGSDLIEATLSIQGYYNLPSPPPDPLILNGIVLDKSMYESTFKDVSGIPVLFRRYTVCFADPAFALWSQHFPITLYTDAKMSDVIQAQVVEKISLTLDWDNLNESKPVICVACLENQASFYDFLIWYIHSQNGVWNYDSQANTYKISKQKDSQGQAANLDELDVEKIETYFPSTIRYNVALLNAYSETPQTEDVTQDQAVTGIKHNVLARTPIAAEFTKIKTLETDKLKIRTHEIKVWFKNFPRITFKTGSLINFEKGFWSDKIYSKGKEYRVYEVKIKAQASDQEPEHDRDMAFTGYKLDMTASLELKDNPWLNLPAFNPPCYPIYVEGKIISESGEETDKTYQIYKDENTSLEFYKINVPLWDKKVVVSYIPNLIPGHFYFPVFKNSRVLLALYLNKAEIVQFLDWGSEVRLPADTQGNHLLFGKNKTSQTSMNHIYDQEKPVLNIKRTCSEDTELIQLKEGTIIIQTQKESSQ